MARERKYDFGLVASELENFFNNQLKTVLGVTAVNFFRSNFDVEGFQDGGVEKWVALSEARKEQKGEGKKILTDTGDLKRSIHWKPISNGVEIIADEPYASIHNEGDDIVATVTVSEHTRKTKWGTVTVKEHTREMNTTMPQRQYMGNSADLRIEIEKAVARRITCESSVNIQFSQSALLSSFRQRTCTRLRSLSPLRSTTSVIESNSQRDTSHNRMIA